MANGDQDRTAALAREHADGRPAAFGSATADEDVTSGDWDSNALAVDSGNDNIYAKSCRDAMDGVAGASDYCSGSTGVDIAANCETTIGVP